MITPYEWKEMSCTTPLQRPTAMRFLEWKRFSRMYLPCFGLAFSAADLVLSDREEFGALATILLKYNTVRISYQ